MRQELRKISRLADRLEQTDRELRDAMTRAHEAGIPIQQIADAALFSFEKARRIVKGIPWR